MQSKPMLFTFVAMLSASLSASAGSEWKYWEVNAIEGTTRIGCVESGDRMSYNGIEFTINKMQDVEDERSMFRKLRIHARFDDSRLQAVRMATPDCQLPEDAGTKVSFSTDASLDFLEQALDGAPGHLASEIIAAIAHHADERATGILEAATGSTRRPIWSSAIFWLPVRRGDAGIAFVETIIRDSDDEERRKEAVFPYAISAEEGAVPLLKVLVEKDASVQVASNAVFSLSQTGARGLEPFFINVASSDRHRSIKEQSLFALSQIDSEESARALLDFARNPGNGELRRTALFWLAQSDRTIANDALIKIIED